MRGRGETCKGSPRAFWQWEKAGGRFAAPIESDLAENALVRESLHELLRGKVLVPKFGEALVLFVQLGVEAVIAVTNEAAPLLDTYKVISPVERVSAFDCPGSMAMRPP